MRRPEFFFFKICIFESQCYRQWASIYWLTPQMATVGEPGKARILRPPTWAARAQALKPFSVAFPKPSARKAKQPGRESTPHCSWQFYPLCQPWDQTSGGPVTSVWPITKTSPKLLLEGWFWPSSDLLVEIPESGVLALPQTAASCWGTSGDEWGWLQWSVCPASRHLGSKPADGSSVFSASPHEIKKKLQTIFWGSNYASMNISYGQTKLKIFCIS